MGFTRWLLRPRDKQVLWRADICQGLYLHSVVISGGGGVRCHVFWGIGYWSPPLLEWIPSPRKLWNEEQIGVQWEAPVIPKWSTACGPSVPSDWPPGVWDFHLSGVGRTYSNRSLPVNILRCSVTPLTSVLSTQGSFSRCKHLYPGSVSKLSIPSLSKFNLPGGILGNIVYLSYTVYR